MYHSAVQMPEGVDSYHPGPPPPFFSLLPLTHLLLSSPFPSRQLLLLQCPPPPFAQTQMHQNIAMFSKEIYHWSLNLTRYSGYACASW